MAGTGGGVTNTSAPSPSSGTQDLLTQLSQAEQQALADMVAIQKNQIAFNQQMNDAQTAKQVAEGFAIHS
jgi:hypothetical protein